VGESALGNSLVLAGSRGDLDHLHLAYTFVNSDAREVELSGVDTQERRRVLLVVDTTPAVTESTASIEPAGKAERATAAKSEALVPWVQDGVRRGREMVPQDYDTEQSICSLKCRAASLPH